MINEILLQQQADTCVGTSGILTYHSANVSLVKTVIMRSVSSRPPWKKEDVLMFVFK